MLGCGLKVPASFWKVLLSALSERDETADVCMDGDGNPEPDPELRDTESVPLDEDVDAFFEREVSRMFPPWIDTAIHDTKDKEVGKVGYEVNSPILLPVPATTPVGRNRIRYSGTRKGHHGDAAGGGRMKTNGNGVRQ